MNRSRLRLILAVFCGALIGTTPAAAVSIGTHNDFESGTVQDWSTIVAHNTSVQIGGPAGPNDHFLLVTSDGSNNAGKLVTPNRSSDWLGDYLVAGVTQIAMDLKNLDDSVPIQPLSIRLAFKETTFNSSRVYVTTNPFVVLADNAWHHAVFNVTASDYTTLNNLGNPPLTFEQLISNPAELRIQHSANVATDAGIEFINSKLGIDNITALGAPATISDRWVFYNNSQFDGRDPGASALDFAAIATDKAPLLPGGTATSANYTSYNRGLNGFIVGITHLAGTPTASDFSFKVGNNNDPGTWTTLALAPTVSIQPGVFPDDPAYVTLIFPDQAIKKQWLEVTVKNSAATGLAAPHVFYFGNAVGESLDNAGNATVDAADFDAVVANLHSFTNPVDVTFPYDFNRDSLVNATDEIFARTNGTSGSGALQLISVPAALTSTSLAVPEPSSWILLACATLALGWIARPRTGLAFPTN